MGEGTGANYLRVLVDVSLELNNKSISYFPT